MDFNLIIQQQKFSLKISILELSFLFFKFYSSFVLVILKQQTFISSFNDSLRFLEMVLFNLRFLFFQESFPDERFYFKFRQVYLFVFLTC